MSLSPNLTVMVKAAEKAARSLVRDFGEVEKLQVSVKGPGDFVSRADRRSEEILVESLQKDRPDWGFLNEEGGEIKGRDGKYRWIIDPLDGTSNFLHGIPHWCITMALEKTENGNSEIIAGLTYDPIRQELFRVEKGGGSFMNNSRLRVSGRKDLDRAIVAIGTMMRAPEEIKRYQDIWAKIFVNCAGARQYACAGLNLAYVAAGRFDINYNLGGVKPWDIAAGILLVREAGGTVTDLKLGSEMFARFEVFAANPVLHAKFQSLLSQV
jgi:myo-inositol-1(or 4)-monophosphatase